MSELSRNPTGSLRSHRLHRTLVSGAVKTSGVRRPLAARPAPDGHHARVRDGSHIPAGADDVEAPGSEDRHCATTTAGRTWSNRPSTSFGTTRSKTVNDSLIAGARRARRRTYGPNMGCAWL